jgi:hypothetical protein
MRCIKDRPSNYSPNKGEKCIQRHTAPYVRSAFSSEISASDMNNAVDRCAAAPDGTEKACTDAISAVNRRNSSADFAMVEIDFHEGRSTLNGPRIVIYCECSFVRES